MALDKVLSVAKIVASTSVDGPGLRSSLYLQGCKIRCEGCHNSQFWNYSEGKMMTVEEVYDQLIDADENISILGGEPLLQYKPLRKLCKLIKKTTDKTIWLWSGYTYEQIQEKWPEILQYIDVLVDGPFVMKLRDTSLQFRGSSNQRIIHLH